MKTNNSFWLKEIFNHVQPKSIIAQINSQEPPATSDTIEASIVIPCYNEEKNVLRCILSLLTQNADFSYEIIVVDNNSSDKSREYLEQCDHIRLYHCRSKGVEHARQKGLEKARGQFYFSVDADSLYPPDWLRSLHWELKAYEDVRCVYSKFSYLPKDTAQRPALAMFEGLREVARFGRRFNRPYLNCRGLSMAFSVADARQIGFRAPYQGRGEDGRMALELAKLGKVKNVSSTSTKVWTDPGFLLDHSLQGAILKFGQKELSRSLGYIFKKFVPKA